MTGANTFSGDTKFAAVSAETLSAVGLSAATADIGLLSADAAYSKKLSVDSETAGTISAERLSSGYQYVTSSDISALGVTIENAGMISAEFLKSDYQYVTSSDVSALSVFNEKATAISAERLSSGYQYATSSDVSALNVLTEVADTISASGISSDALSVGSAVLNELSTGSLVDIKIGDSSMQEILDLSVNGVSAVISAIFPYLMELHGDISADPSIVKYDSLSAWMKGSILDKLDSGHSIKLGYVYRASSSVEFENHAGFKANDHIVVNKNVTLETITFDDVQVIKDYDDYIASLSAETASLENDVDYVSAQTVVSVANVESEIALSVANIESEIALSVGNIESEIALSAATLSADVKTLSVAYNDTFVSADRAANDHISSDNLVITDSEAHVGSPDVHDRYYVTMKYGTMVMTKIED